MKIVPVTEPATVMVSHISMSVYVNNWTGCSTAVKVCHSIKIIA